MAKKKVVKRKSRSIIIGHLEKISSKVFDQYRKQIAEIIKSNYGVYALYRRDKLYYIGLATDFKKRINQHLKDRHKGKWNYFSLYLIRKSDHIREVEALLLRIADPRGNYQKGKLKGSKNLGRQLKRLMKEDFMQFMDEAFGAASKKKKARAKKKAIKKTQKKKPLKGLMRNYQRIYATYKGHEYKAKVLPNGTIEMVGSKEHFNSPSGAGKAIVDTGTVNGWRFWKYKNKAGELVPLSHLLK